MKELNSETGLESVDAQESFEFEIKYSFSADIKLCRQRVITNQRLSSPLEFKQMKKSTVHFDDEGICDACHYAEQKLPDGWELRHRVKTLAPDF